MVYVILMWGLGRVEEEKVRFRIFFGDKVRRI